MSEDKIFIDFEGPDAEGAARELAAVIEEEFGVAPALSAAPAQQANNTAVTRDIPLELISVAAGVMAAGLTIPSAVLASLDLKDRLAKKKKFERVTEKVAQAKQARQGLNIRFRFKNLVEIEIEKETTYAEVTDHLINKD